MEDMERDRVRVALRTSEETEETVEETEDETVEKTDEETDETDEVTDETDEENVLHRAVTEYHGGVCLDEDRLAATTKSKGWHILYLPWIIVINAHRVGLEAGGYSTLSELVIRRGRVRWVECVRANG